MAPSNLKIVLDLERACDVRLTSIGVVKESAGLEISGFKTGALPPFTTKPNPRVGCVIARKNKIIGEGWHVRAGQDHAEIAALTAANHDVRGADVFVSLEPCSHHGKTGPCASALRAAQSLSRDVKK